MDSFIETKLMRELDSWLDIYMFVLRWCGEEEAEFCETIIFALETVIEEYFGEVK